MENLDLREILKNVPKGTKLYSTIYGEIYFDCINCNNQPYPIQCHNIHRIELEFTKEGKYHYKYDGECILFPSKEQRDWSKFELPCQFKLGDVLINNNETYITIFNKKGCVPMSSKSNVLYYNCYYNLKYGELKIKIDYGIGITSDYRYANEKEKNILFDRLQKEGYFWNGETKSLEKYKFKVGDKIQDKVSKQIYTIYDIEHAKYKVNVNKDIQGYLFAAFQNQFELYKEKFDITTLKPYDKVLVRRNNDQSWLPTLFAFYHDNKEYCFKFVTIDNVSYRQCIPYEGNEYLIGTTNECDEYYKTWK